MKAGAYAYADGTGHKPTEILLDECIQRYGAEAVTGRATLRARDILCMNYARELIEIYQSRAASQNWATWAGNYPKAARNLLEAGELANNERDS